MAVISDLNSLFNGTGTGGLGDVARGIVQGDVLRDWRHASKLFVDGNYAYVPKHGFLFHVAFEFSPDALESPGMPKNKDDRLRAGLLAKSVTLPKFSFDTKTLNAYNRPNIVQSKIKYDPISLSFHDDNSDVVNKLWQAYQRYYYLDGKGSSSHLLNPLQQRHKYESGNGSTRDWGYYVGDGKKENAAPFFHAIRLYSLHNRKFSEYVLVNPNIKAFKFGDHASDSTNLMQADMTIEYETVIYQSGTVSATGADGFADIHYDKGPSPIAPLGGGTTSILGEGGLFGSAGSILSDLAAGNIGSAILTGARTASNFDAVSLGKMVLGESVQALSDVAMGRNPLSGMHFPTAADITNATNDINSVLSNSGQKVTTTATSNKENVNSGTVI